MNAKTEFLEHTEDKPKVVCAVIEKDVEWKPVRLATLYEGYSEDEYNEFLRILDTYEYDDGYGSQELYGTIWYEDGTYSGRGKYDGSEWWEYRKAPEKPAQQTKQVKEK